MRKTMQKVLAITLAGMMMMGAAACGSNGQQESLKEDPGSNTVDKEGNGKEESTDSGKAGQEADAYVPGTLPLTKDNVKLTIGLSGKATTEDYETNEYTKWLEEQTGIDLEFMVFSGDGTEFQNQLTMMMTTDEKLPDIILEAPFGNDGVKQYGMDGYFVDISTYLEDAYWYNQALEVIPQKDAEIVKAIGKAENGAIYGYPYYAKGSFDSMLAPCFINKEWLAAVDAEMPTTTEELYNILVKFRDEDPNGNGEADEIPITGSITYRSATDQWLINAFVYCVDEYLWDVTDGKVWSPYSTDEYREAMIYLNKLVSENLLSTMVFTGDEFALKPIVTPAEGENIVGVVTCHPTLHMDENNPCMKEYAAVPPLKAANGSTVGGFAPFYTSSFKALNVITEDCENPELAFRFLDFMSSPESALRERYGVYGEDWTDAEEGEYSSAGIPARLKVLNAAAYTEQGNRTYHNIFCQLAVPSQMATAYVDDGSGSAWRISLFREELDSYNNSPVPDEVFTLVFYTAEEEEIVTELQSMYREYVKEARGLFATGAMDPADDNDWNSYLSELEGRGQSKLLECAQAAYDRLKQ